MAGTSSSHGVGTSSAAGTLTVLGGPSSDFHLETAAEAIRAGIDPAEIEALFNESDVAKEAAAEDRRSQIERYLAIRAYWAQHSAFGQAYLAFAEIMEKLVGPSPRFDFRGYSVTYPYQLSKRSQYRAAQRSFCSLGQIWSSATRKDLAVWRTRFHVPSDVEIFAPAENERADQPQMCMVAVNEAIMEVGLRFPLSFAVSHLLSAWNVVPLQLTSNAWLQIICTLTMFGGHRLYRLPSPSEMNHLFKLTAQKGSVGGYHIQG